MPRYVDSLPEAARQRLAEEVFRYFSQGAGAGVSAGEAEGAWSRLRFRPRVLHDVTHVDTGTSLLGTRVASPFGIAPTTLQRAADPDGELATARAAHARGSLLVVSSNAGTAFEAIGGTGASWWLQMYLTADRDATVPVVDRAVAAGAGALVLTADTPVVATKEAGARAVWDVVDPSWLRVNFPEAPSGGPAAAGTAGRSAGEEKATDLGPQDVAWLAERWGLPVVVKGVLHPADARRCVDAGAAAVWVSNHGGRQLDRAMTTVDALPAVAEAVAGQAEVYVDGGVRRGADALAARALGARAVFLGRPPLYALADAGADGVGRLLLELAEELREAMRLAGVATLDAVPGDLLHRPGSDGPTGEIAGLGTCDPGHARPI